MEELAHRAPEAQQYLAAMPPDVQEDIASRLSELGHESAVRQSSDIYPASHIPPEEHTPEQAKNSERVTGMMTEAARLTQIAHDQLAKQGVIEPDYYSSTADKVFERAKDIALREAVEARQNGEEGPVQAGIQNALVLELLHPKQATEGITLESRFGSLIEEGMAVDLLQVAHDMHGVIALSGPGTVSNLLEPLANPIRIAANADFDDQFQEIVTLVRPGQPVEDTERRNEIIDQTSTTGLAILANDAARNRENPALASYYATKVAEKIASEVVKTGHETKSQTVVDSLIAADTHIDEANRHTLDKALDQLRSIRNAGLKPYRVNIPATSILDRAVIDLTLQGRTDMASSLLSSSPHELSDEPGVDYSGGNLEFALQQAIEYGGLDQAVAQDVKTRIQELQKQKTAECIQTLEQAGAPPETISNIIQNSPDPDSALQAPPEFWPQYARIIQNQDSASTAERLLAKNIKTLIEGPASYDLETVTSLMMSMQEHDVPAEFYSEEVLRILKESLEPEQIRPYLEGLSVVGKKIHAIEEMYDGEKNRILTSLLPYNNPEQALDMVTKIYGHAESKYVQKFTTMLGKGYRTFAETIEIPENVNEAINSDAFIALLSNTDFTTDLRDTLAETVIGSQEPLNRALEISQLLNTGEFAELIGENGAGFGLRSALIKSVIESQQMTEAAKSIVSVFGGGSSLWHTTSQLAELSVGDSFYCTGARISRIPISLPTKQTTTHEEQAISYVEGEYMLEHLRDVYGVDIEGLQTEAGSVDISLLPEELKKTLLTAHLYESITMSRNPKYRQLATKRNSEVNQEDVFQLNNLHHFTSHQALAAILQNGLLPGEFIASQMRADSFPFNVDLVESTPNVLIKSTYRERLDELASRGYGDMALHITRSGDGQDFRDGEEYPATDIGYEGQHRLMPGGFPATEISAVTIKNPDALNSIRAALLEAGMFIPVFNADGETIYSYEQHQQDRRDGNYDVVVPEIVDSQFERPNSQGGSNEGAEFIVPSLTPGERPTRYYCKFAQLENTEHLWSELLADELYRTVTPELVPETRPVILEGRLARASKIVEIDGQPVTDEARNAGFIMDAYLGNWDATYNSANLVMSSGQAMRIDTGNALFFRARGDRKDSEQFSAVVSELEDGADQGNLGTGMRQNYPNITNEGIQEQVNDLVTNLSDERIDQIVDGVRMPEAERQTLKEVLKARRDYILTWSQSVSTAPA